MAERKFFATCIAIQFGPDMGVSAAAVHNRALFSCLVKVPGGKGVATGLGFF